MKKKILKTMSMLCLIFVLIFAATVPVSAASKGYSFKYKGVSITINSKAKSFIKKAGEPKKIKRSKSCAYKGEDIVRTYSDFKLTTYTKKKGGTEYVSSIEITGKGVSTPEKIKVGSKKSTVIKKYGKAKAQFGVLTYKKGKTKIVITINNNKVKSIKYLAK